MIAPVPDDWTQLPGRILPLEGFFGASRSDLPHEIDELARFESLVAAQGRVLERLTADEDLSHVLLVIARMVEAHTAALCAILIVDTAGATLRAGAIPTLPERFVTAMDGLKIGSVAGSCGTAAFRRAPVVSPDISNDPLWSDHRELMMSLGVRAAWSLPVIAPGGEVVATLAMYASEQRLPDEWEMRVAGLAVSLTALAMQRSGASRTTLDSDAGYRLLWETSPDVVMLLDEESRIQAASPAMLQVFGYAPDEVIGRDLAMLQPERLREAHRAGMRRYLATGEKKLDWRATRIAGLHKDGHEFAVELAFSDLQIDGTRQFAGFARDVSERARAEEALKQGEARYRALAENAFDLVCELDSQGRFAYVSPNFKEVLGYEPAALIGGSPFELIHPEDRERVFQQFADAISENAPPGTSTFRLKREDGAWCWLEVSANFYRDEAGESHAVILARDIAARMAMEATLRDSEERLRTFVEHAPLILTATDRQGRYVLQEGAGLARFGIGPGTHVGQSIFELHADDPRVCENLRRALGGESFSDVVEFFGVTFEVHHEPMRDESGDVTGMIAILIDVTARVHAEDALRESEAQLRSFVSNAPLILFATDRDGVFTLFDGNGVEPLGVARGQYVGESIFEAMADFPDITDGARRALAGETVTYLFRAEHVALEVHQSPVRDGAGEITGTIGLVINVSERMRVEGALHESEGHLRTVVENAPVILFATDAEGVYTLSEGAGLASVGLAPGQYVGRSVFEVYADLPAVIDGTRRALAGEAATYEFRLGRAALDVMQSPVRDATGEVVGTIGVAIDISNRIQAEMALRKSEERYRAIYETHRVVRLLVDPATGLIEEANPAASDFYGYSVEEMAGMPLSIISTSPAPEILAGLEEIREATASVVKRQHRLKSGEIRDVEFFGSPVDVDGRQLIYGIVQDVTERSWAESLVTAQKQLLEMVAVDAPLTDVLERVALTFEERAPGALCSVLLISPDGTQLRHAAAPSLPAAYAEAIDGVAIGPSVGSCGTAAYLRREIIVEDIATDPLWADFRELALSLGLRSCWSTPVLSATGEVLATFAVYHREPGGVRERERTLLEIATHVAGIAIEQDRAAKAVRSRTEELERLSRRLADANDELEESKQHLEEKSFLLERGLEQERERSRRDQLTGALNHAAIADVVRETIRDHAGRSLAIAMVDVDGLKAVNDTYGHQVGDAVLVLVAQKLARDGAIVGRYGGDEFVAIIPSADRAAAEQYREGVQASLAGAGLIDEQSGSHIPVVVSMGLAVYPEEAEAVDDLIRLSDSAMYESRRQWVADGGESSSRSLGGDRAAKMVGEIVPLLTSSGALADKLRLVSHRLSVGAGYDAVDFTIFAATPGAPIATNVFARVPVDAIEAWRHAREEDDSPEPHPLRTYFERSPRPVIIEDLTNSELLTPSQRTVMAAVGLRGGLVAPLIWRGQVEGMLAVGSKQLNAFTVRDVEFLGAVATQVTAIVRMSSLVEELQTSTSQLQRAHERTVLMLASAAEAHDHTTGRHLQRVRAISEAIARELGYDDERAAALGMAAILHDIGKIRVPDSVLGSSNSLAEAEWALMKQHTVWGAAFLSDQPGFELAASVARHHHERWDGAGYPDGLSGEEIPESALITAVADSFDAMTNHRPYRRGRPVDEAVREIQSCSDTQFSPHVVDALTRLFERGELAFVHPDEDEQAAA